ncbi:hypothetical protein SAMN04515674_105252 [Pseudarcicella hirudinis]|uniref:Uncharacterized protein n=1 Tax=Pseudarcicella hirudinis TaxID=1079859 RepID=A0A1I5SWQ3_9BACT|nr:hypothetical protein [Pseudarcicella hirudinis]SFP75205.1 hypothetical protein SAMN04515674_105252 [Pseudarcicella hirudinis]
MYKIDDLICEERVFDEFKKIAHYYNIMGEIRAVPINLANGERSKFVKITFEFEGLSTLFQVALNVGINLGKEERIISDFEEHPVQN